MVKRETLTKWGNIAENLAQAIADLEVRLRNMGVEQNTIDNVFGIEDLGRAEDVLREIVNAYWTPRIAVYPNLEYRRDLDLGAVQLYIFTKNLYNETILGGFSVGVQVEKMSRYATPPLVKWT